MDPFGASGNGGKHHFGRGHGEVGAVVLADAEGIDAQPIGEDRPRR